MTIPTIEDLVAPHLARLRSEAELKRGEPVKAVSIEFIDGQKCGLRHRYNATVEIRSGATYYGFGDDVAQAIHEVVAQIKASPDLAAILGYEEKNK